MASRNPCVPKKLGYTPIAGSLSASLTAAIICGAVGKEGMPCPKLIPLTAFTLSERRLMMDSGSFSAKSCIEAYCTK